MQNQAITISERMVGAGLSPAEFQAWGDLLALPGPAPPTPLGRLLALPAWAVPELVATEASRSRLRAWSAAGSPVPGPDRLVRELKFMGDAELRTILLDALHERVPPPVIHDVLGRVTFLGIGWSSRGLALAFAAPEGPVLDMVLLSGASHDRGEVLDVALHEIAHKWLLPAPAMPVQAAAAFNETGALLIAAARRPELMAELLADEARGEEQADRLSRAWGGHLSCTAALDTAYTRRHAAHLAEQYGGTA